MEFKTYDEALDYSRRYGQRAKKLGRMSVSALTILDAQLMQSVGETRVYGKLSKDELIADILQREFPGIRDADEFRAAHAREQRP